MTPLVSVVIPAYNAAAFIEKALNSVLAQTVSDLEVIVVDDGSSDATRAVVASLTKRDARLCLYTTSNRGVERARNLGLEHARGEWVAFLDADDWWELEKLQRQLAFLEAHPEVEVTSSYGRYGGSGSRRLGHLRYGPVSHTELEEQRLALEPIWLLTPSVLCRRDILLASGGFNPDFKGASEDLDLWTRLSYQHEARTLPEPLVNVRISGGSASMRKFELIQQNVLRVRQNLLRQQVGDPELSARDFAVWFAALDHHTLNKLRQDWSSGYFYRCAGHAFLEGAYLSGVRNLARSLFYQPDYPIKRLKRQLWPTPVKTEHGQNLLGDKR